VLSTKIERVWQAHLQVYGPDKVWRHLRRAGTDPARCTVERLMRRGGLRGVMRGKVVRTTVPDAKTLCPLDRVNRQFKARRPNQLWVSDFTYVSTWQSFVYLAFVIDVFARRIVAGVQAARSDPTSYSTLWNRRCMTTSRSAAMRLSTTATAARSTSPSGTASVLQKPA